MPVGERSHKLGGDFRAIDGPGGDAEIVEEDGNIEPSEMKNLQHGGICQKLPEIRGVIAAFLELHEVSIPVSGGQLNDAKPVAERLQPKRFCIDCDRVAEIEAGRQVVLVDGHGHGR